MKPFLIFIFILFSFNSFSQKTPKDNVDKKYIFVVKLSPQEWKAITDTSSIIINELGKTMSVDNATIYKEAMIRQLNAIARKITLDSIVTKPIKN